MIASPPPLLPIWSDVSRLNPFLFNSEVRTHALSVSSFNHVSVTTAMSILLLLRCSSNRSSLFFIDWMLLSSRWSCFILLPSWSWSTIGLICTCTKFALLIPLVFLWLWSCPLFMVLLYFIFKLFYSYFIVKPHEAELLWCWGQLFVGNLMKHRCCGAEVIYFVFSSEMENRTLSQMCGRLYLAIFLFRVGLLTLIYISSFMALTILCSSLPIVLKLSTVVVWPVVFWCSMIGDGAFKCSLYCSSNVLADSPIYSSSHSILPHPNQYIVTLFCYWIFVFLEYQ